MFYEERVRGGVLMCRSLPFGKWRVATTPHANVVNALMKLAAADRKAVFSKFCYHCGNDNAGCGCWDAH